jgi:ATP-binding cassette subfamily F protein 3
VHRLEKEIQELEQRQGELTAELEKHETYEQPGRAVAINREIVGIQDKLASLTPEWEAAATRLAELDAQ